MTNSTSSRNGAAQNGTSTAGSYSDTFSNAFTAEYRTPLFMKTFCISQHRYLDSIIANNIVSVNSADYQTCQFRLNALEDAEALRWSVDHHVNILLSHQRKERAEDLNNEITNLSNEVASRRSEQAALRQSLNSGLGEAGILPSPGGMTTESLDAALRKREEQDTLPTVAGPLQVHTSDNPKDTGNRTKQSAKYVIDLLAALALGGVQAMAFGHGMGLLTPSQIINVSRPEWLLFLSMVCSVLTLCSCYAISNIFRMLVRTFPSELENAGPISLPSRNRMPARFSTSWIVVALFIPLILVECSSIAVKMGVFRSIQQKSEQQTALLDSPDTASERSEFIQPTNTKPADVSLPMGLVITTVFFLFKSSGAIRQEECARRHDYLTYKQCQRKEERRARLLPTILPALDRIEQLDRELEKMEPVLHQLELERRELYRTVPTPLMQLLESHEKLRIDARTAYEDAGDKLIETIRLATTAPSASNMKKPSATSRLRQSWNKLWNSKI